MTVAFARRRRVESYHVSPRPAALGGGRAGSGIMYGCPAATGVPESFRGTARPFWKGTMNSASEASAAARLPLRRRVVGRVFGRWLRQAQARLVGPGTLPVAGIHRILVCRPNHRLGNVLLLTPLVRTLEEVFPGAEIDLLVGTGAAHDIFAGYDRVRRVINLGARMARHPLRLLVTLRQLRANGYDLVVDAGRGSQSGRIFAAMIGGRRLLGVPEDQDGDDSAAGLHFAHRPVQALAEALAEPTRLPAPFPPLTVHSSAAARATAQRVLARLCAGAPQGPRVAVFTNATGAKKLAPAWWHRFLDRVQAQRPDCALVEMLPAFGRSPLECRLPAYFSTDIRAMAAFCTQLQAFVSADCGVMHLASAAGVTTLGLFSRTNPRLYGPFDHGSQAFDVGSLSPEQVADALLERLPPPV